LIDSPSTSLKWRPLGKAGLTLMERGEFASACNYPGSVLAAEPIDEIELRAKLAFASGKTQRRIQSAQTASTQYIGNAPFGYLNISYFLDPESFLDNRSDVIDFINKEAGTAILWRNFIPHVTLATVDRESATEGLLDRFDKFRPDLLHFLGVKVEVG
jgi:hypothetical protein